MCCRLYAGIFVALSIRLTVIPLLSLTTDLTDMFCLRKPDRPPILRSDG